jgi:hypothetical protein
MALQNSPAIQKASDLAAAKKIKYSKIFKVTKGRDPLDRKPICIAAL